MYTTDAIILNIRESGENDIIASAYTKDFGKLSIKARGTRKIATKQGQFLHGHSIIRCSFIAGRAGYILSGLGSKKEYGGICHNLFAQGYLMSFLNLCDNLIYEGQKDIHIWNMLVGALKNTEKSSVLSREDSNLLLWKEEKAWLVELLNVLGLRPERLNIENIKDRRQMDYYLRRVLQNKLERPVTFFGLRALPAKN